MKASEKQLMKGADGLWESNESTCTDSEVNTIHVKLRHQYCFCLDCLIMFSKWGSWQVMVLITVSEMET